jgi:hypothetical protein
VGHRGSIRQLKFSVKVVCHNAAIFYCGKLCCGMSMHFN